jgi:hypothetical protein
MKHSYICRFFVLSFCPDDYEVAGKKLAALELKELQKLQGSFQLGVGAIDDHDNDTA